MFIESRNFMKKLIVALLCAAPVLQAKKVIDGVEKTVVYVDMVADMFHLGHINMLKRAQAMGDYLVVGLMSDEDTASYKRRPICTLQERTAVIAACRYVDKVIPASPLQLTRAFIEQEGIDMVLHGDDMSEETLRFFYAVPMEMGILKTLPYTQGISTSDIIRRVTMRAAEFKSN